MGLCSLTAWRQPRRGLRGAHHQDPPRAAAGGASTHEEKGRRRPRRPDSHERMTEVQAKELGFKCELIYVDSLRLNTSLIDDGL